jgi:hypothetical protein
MSIILKKNKKMDLKIPEFLCDSGLAPISNLKEYFKESNV